MKLVARAIAGLLLAATLVPAPLTASDGEVRPDMLFPPDAVWKHAFDARKGAADTINDTFVLATVFREQLFGAGVDPERIKVAVVVKGPASFDVVSDAAYARRYPGKTNPNADNVARIIAGGGEIWLCGATAKSLGIDNGDLLPGVRMAISAMTAYADLHRRGFGLNPL